MKNPKLPEIIVIDPRRTETAVSATLHLPVRPKTDLVLFYGLANLFDREGLDRPRIRRGPHVRFRGVCAVCPTVRLYSR